MHSVLRYTLLDNACFARIINPFLVSEFQRRPQPDSILIHNNAHAIRAVTAGFKSLTVQLFKIRFNFQKFSKKSMKSDLSLSNTMNAADL